MRKLFQSVKDFINKVITTIKSIFAPVVTSEPSVDSPYYSGHIKQGEVGGYLMLDDKNKITSQFVQNVKNLGLNIVYINTPRNKQNPVTFEDWLQIFDKFKDSGVKLMLYIYEAVSMNVKWTDEQIKTISNHPAFYGWIAEDEVTYKSFDTSNAWIKRFHDQKWEDGSKKWPNMAICFLPRIQSLGVDAISENYSLYLLKWKDAVDVTHADMYPFIASQKNNAHYNIETDGTPVYSKTSGGEKWFEYLTDHCSVFSSGLTYSHRLYMNSCKHIAKDNNGVQYIVRPKPTELPLKIQALANLITGSNGLMLFVLNDFGKFSEAAFNNNLGINRDTYNLLKNIFTNQEFNNFKNIMVNLKVVVVDWENELLMTQAQSNQHSYKFYLNTSLTENATVNVELDRNYKVLNFKNLTVEEPKSQYTLKPGEMLCIKRKESFMK